MLNLYQPCLASDWANIYAVVGGIDLFFSFFHFFKFSTTSCRCCGGKEEFPRGIGGLLISLPIVPFIGYCCERGEDFLFNNRYYISWISIRHALWVVLMLLWIVPSFLYVDRVGGSWGGEIISYNNMSSCQAMSFVLDTSKTGFCKPRSPVPAPPNNVYNPNGALGAGKVWKIDTPYATCYMDQTWKQAVDVDQSIVLGYAETTFRTYTIPDCSTQSNPGLVSYGGCFTSDGTGLTDGVCTGSFPVSSSGVVIPPAGADYLVTNNATNQLVQKCPGSGTKEQPTLLCPSCLWYYINVVSGIKSAENNAIIDQCFKDYVAGGKDPNSVPLIYFGLSNRLCGLCPSRNHGWPKWNYSYDGMICSYWLFSTLTWFLPLFRWTGIITVILWREEKRKGN